MTKDGRKVVDCFIFFNELDMLEIRLNEMDSFVDYFVLVEGRQNFKGESKPCYFQDHKEERRFKKFEHRILHYMIDIPTNENNPVEGIDWSVAWNGEIFSRNQTMMGINQLVQQSIIDDNDLVLLSDVDEIIKAETFNQSDFTPDVPVKFNLSFRYYKMNCRAIGDGWGAPVMVPVKWYTDPQNTRHNNNPVIPWDKVQWIPDAGWHFSYMGGSELIIPKIEGYGHQEYNNEHFKDKARLMQKIAYGEDLFDRGDQGWEFIRSNDYPRYVLENMEYFVNHFQVMKWYKFRCIIPFTGNYDSLNWAIESMHREIVKWTYLDKPIIVFNNTKQDFDWDKINKNMIGNFTVEDYYEPYLLPQILNWGIRRAKKLGEDFMFWMHDDAALHCNGLKILLDKYEEVKDLKWASIYLSKMGDVCSLYNFNYNYTENVWYEPILFPLYFMDCHYTRIARLKGWSIEYANWDPPKDYVVHPGSHTIKENQRLNTINNFMQESWRLVFEKIWGGQPGQETITDPNAQGTA